ncbi:cyclic nucleotide-gated ion channel [Methyloligella sp. 2.7D]|uniref:cyclic nucleotide-gated ion channel n=1 Tax=unclassified Methyloligella TaxID=2625955 RepID=UPI00157DC1DA|nr:cyclic nucleotide-gated ion channel [Methyloligella sp. GL2]QKP77857.1 ion transporter [Methyloligella sp. GL2]
MSDGSLWRRWRRKTYDILEVGGTAHPAARFVDAFLITLIVANAVSFALETVEPFATEHARALWHFNAISVVVFTIEYILRLWSAVEIPLFRNERPWRARAKFAARPIMVIDFLAVAPWYLGAFIPLDLRILRVIRLFRLLKLARYSPALQTMQRVFVQEWRALFGALLVLVVMLLFCASMMYFLERDAQPDKFGSIPAALWWGLATITTIGYGDVVPITPLGKIFGSFVMVLGLAAFAMPVAILAAGFGQEVNRHAFVATWGKVARVPLFATLDAAEIAEVTKLVFTQVFAPGSPIVSAGDPGGAMFILESGEAQLSQRGRRKRLLKEGDFFGEMALLEHRRHQHTVTAKTPCRVYVLDSVALAQLVHRHPELLTTIRTEAERRERQQRQAAAAPGKARTAKRKAAPRR